jgi:hypothetical protein
LNLNRSADDRALSVTQFEQGKSVMNKRSIFIAAICASKLLIAVPAIAGGIQVDDGMGGWKPYVSPRIPAGPTGISVGDGRGGWKAYIPPARPGPGISVDDGNGGWKPYTPPARRGGGMVGALSVIG